MTYGYNFYDKRNTMILLPKDTEDAKNKLQRLFRRGAVRKITLTTEHGVQSVSISDFREKEEV